MQLNNKFILFMDVYYIIIKYEKFIYINFKKTLKYLFYFLYNCLKKILNIFINFYIIDILCQNICIHIFMIINIFIFGSSYKPTSSGHCLWVQ